MNVRIFHDLLRRGRLVLLLLLALLVRPPAARAYTFNSYYEEGPVRIPPGQLLQGHVDVATGAFVTVAPCGAVRNPGMPLTAAIYIKTQDGGVGPFGPGTSCPDDWFIFYSSVSSCYELVGPGNQHYAFNVAYTGEAIDTLDPFLLGAGLFYPYSGIQVNGNWYYFYVTFKNGTTWCDLPKFGSPALCVKGG